MCPEFDSRIRRHMGVEFVVGSRLGPARFFTQYSAGFPLLKSQIFQIPLNSIRNPTPQVCESCHPRKNEEFYFSDLRLIYAYRYICPISKFIRLEFVGRFLLMFNIDLISVYRSGGFSLFCC